MPDGICPGPCAIKATCLLTNVEAIGDLWTKQRRKSPWLCHLTDLKSPKLMRLADIHVNNKKSSDCIFSEYYFHSVWKENLEGRMSIEADVLYLNVKLTHWWYREVKNIVLVSLSVWACHAECEVARICVSRSITYTATDFTAARQLMCL